MSHNVSFATLSLRVGEGVVCTDTRADMAAVGRMNFLNAAKV